jgi:hypothetical protein
LKCMRMCSKKGCIVTRKKVAEQGFYGCVFCVNARFTDKGSRVNPAVSFINESGGFYHFWRRLVLVVHGMHGKCCSLVVWDGTYRRKAARMMERDGTALMSCWGDDGGKSEGGRRLVEEAKDGEKELCGHVETGQCERSLGMHRETNWKVWFLGREC